MYKRQIDYDNLQFDLFSPTQRSEENRGMIFITALFIMDHLESRLQTSNLTSYSRAFRELAKRLDAHDRAFDGVPVEVLVTLYFQIVNAKRCLDAHLAVSTSASFTPTHLYEIADRIVGYDNEIQKAKVMRKAAKDREPIGTSTSKQQLPSTTSAPRSTKRSGYSRASSSTRPSSSSAATPRPTELSSDTRARMETQITDLLDTVRTQQLTIEALKGRVDTMESDRSKTEKRQELLEKRMLQLSEWHDEQQVSIGRLEIGLEGTKSMTIKHGIQLRGMEKLEQ